MDLSFVLFAVVCFLAVVLAVDGAYNMWASTRSAEAKRLSDRLQALSGELLADTNLEKSRQSERLPQLNQLLGRVPAGARITRFVHESSLAVSAAEVILTSLALGALGLALPYML